MSNDVYDIVMTWQCTHVRQHMRRFNVNRHYVTLRYCEWCGLVLQAYRWGPKGTYLDELVAFPDILVVKP